VSIIAAPASSPNAGQKEDVKYKPPFAKQMCQIEGTRGENLGREKMCIKDNAKPAQRRKIMKS